MVATCSADFFPDLEFHTMELQSRCVPSVWTPGRPSTRQLIDWISRRPKRLLSSPGFLGARCWWVPSLPRSPLMEVSFLQAYVMTSDQKCDGPKTRSQAEVLPIQKGQGRRSRSTPGKYNMEPENGPAWKTIYLYNPVVKGLG